MSVARNAKNSRVATVNIARAFAKIVPRPAVPWRRRRAAIHCGEGQPQALLVHVEPRKLQASRRSTEPIDSGHLCPPAPPARGGAGCRAAKFRAFDEECCISDEIREALAGSEDTIEDLHVWQISPGHFSAIVSLATRCPRDNSLYKAKLSHIHDLSHLTVETQAIGYLRTERRRDAALRLAPGLDAQRVSIVRPPGPAL